MGIHFEDVLGFVTLEADLLFWNDKYSKGSRMFTIKKQKREKCQEPECSYYTKEPSIYDKYSCHCGNENEESKDISKCCNEHKECIKAMKKKHDCPEVDAGMNYIEINTSKYKIEKKIFKDRQEIECLTQPACKQMLCECDR
uniref:Phospholipase A2 domain-containing protein n=1 Tax=Meloidogyne javanica TaxID=6303 RepID=A0A915NBK2_MELJA